MEVELSDGYISVTFLVLSSYFLAQPFSAGSSVDSLIENFMALQEETSIPIIIPSVNPMTSA